MRTIGLPDDLKKEDGTGMADIKLVEVKDGTCSFYKINICSQDLSGVYRESSVGIPRSR